MRTYTTTYKLGDLVLTITVPYEMAVESAAQKALLHFHEDVYGRKATELPEHVEPTK